MIDTIIEYMKEFVAYPPVLLIGAVTIIQITPIQINPWEWLFSWIGDKINGDIKRDLAELKRDFEENKTQDMRWNILNFANSCRFGRRHTREEWEHVISEIKRYEDYVEKNDVSNGVMQENAKYLRELYRKILHENDFL